jgi:hypothetical protein
MPDQARLFTGIVQINSECVAEHPLKMGDRFGTAVDIHSAAHRAVPPQVIQPDNVIGVRMGVEHRVERHQPRTQGLDTKIRGGIHQNLLLINREQHARSQPAVVRIGRRAGLTVTGQHGHTMRSARTQNRQRHRHVTLVSDSARNPICRAVTLLR